MVIEPKSAESVLNVRVYYEDTDAGGVVFYANYLKFLERARTEWLRALGVEQSALAESEGRLFVVHSLDMSYRKPARLDDYLTIRSRVTRVGRASIHFAQRAERDGELLAQGNIQVCCVDAVHLRPAALPAVVRTKLESLQE
ncbi:tol-pal system-associated acyl-CoA thioesterase [Pseudomonas stutzeri]|nr:tol-pal system-associated acyl-CoA thioesterase [Stutzerimonas stutzeri]